MAIEGRRSLSTYEAGEFPMIRFNEYNNDHLDTMNNVAKKAVKDGAAGNEEFLHLKELYKAYKKDGSHAADFAKFFEFPSQTRFYFFKDSVKNKNFFSTKAPVFYIEIYGKQLDFRKGEFSTRVAGRPLWNQDLDVAVLFSW